MTSPLIPNPARESPRGIIIQAAALIALGGSIGVADAYLRPVKLERAKDEFTLPVAPTPVKSTDGSSQPAQTQSVHTQPVQPQPVQPQPVPTQPAQTQPVQTQPANPAPAVPQPPSGDATTAPGAFVPTPKAELPKGQITLEEAKAAFDTGNVNIVDARTREKFAEGHLPGAVRLELKDFMDSVPAKLGLLDRAKMVIVYCGGGHCDESERVAEQLEGSGCKPIFIIHDGFPGWKAMGYPVEVGEDIE